MEPELVSLTAETILLPTAVSEFEAFEAVTPANDPPMPQPPAPRERQPSAASRERQPSAASHERPPLPRRQRQANLVPQLQLDAQSAPKTKQPRRARTPEEAHNSMSSFQRGTREGRGPSTGLNR